MTMRWRPSLRAWVSVAVPYSSVPQTYNVFWLRDRALEGFTAIAIVEDELVTESTHECGLGLTKRRHPH